MIASKLDAHYARLQAKFAVTEEARFAPLVVPNGNLERPFYRWFHLKEAFSSELLPEILKRSGMDNRQELTLLDPFMGVGTAAISALDWASQSIGRVVRVLGVERNPFLHFAAKTKAMARLCGPTLAPVVSELAAKMASPSGSPHTNPTLSTFQNSHYFPRTTLRHLREIRLVLDQQQPSLATDCARLALAACIEPVSRLRRDGRALRYEPEKRRPRVGVEYDRRCTEMVEDLLNATPVEADVRIVLGDGRTATLTTPGLQADIALFSPPYPNNIDYTEVYKLEAWFLGFFETAADFRSHRHLTVRSHPSVKFSESAFQPPLALDMAKLIDPILAVVPADRYERERRRLIRGYFTDMAQTLSEVRPLMKPGGTVALVVGNSLHGRSEPFVLAADIIIAAIAETLGYQVREILIARRPTRQRSPHEMLRESAILFAV